MNKKIAYQALCQTAKNHNVPLSTVTKEIEEAISLAMNHPDPEIQKFWNSIPRKDAIPTPVEVIAYISNIV